jgi:uncharacterized lipoprotein YmbA
MRFLSLLLVLLMASCASKQKSFYMLTPEGLAPAAGGVGIGIGPVSVASYLAHPNIVFQESSHRFALAESHVWAGDLDDNIAKVLSVNLGRQLHTGNVRTYPWGDDTGLRYQVAVDIRELHGNATGDAVIDATWRVYSLPDRAIVATRSWSATEPLKHDGYDEMVAAESRLLARLAVEIARELK